MRRAGVVKTDIVEAGEIIKHYIDQTTRAGGYIHQSLEFHCMKDTPSKKGSMWLSGVEDDEVSMVVPSNLWIQQQDVFSTLWGDLFKLLGYPQDINDKAYTHRHWLFSIIPLLDMANSGSSGRASSDKRGAILYGTEFEYQF
jgi:hypothetical protein